MEGQALRMIDNTLAEDRRRVEVLLETLAPWNVEPVIVTHYGAPVPWARARTRGGVYFKDKRTRAAAEDLGKVFTQVAARPVSFSNLALVCLFYMPTRHVVDSDNLTKLVMDAATKAHLWEDDSQVTAQTTIIEYCGGQHTRALSQARTVVGLVPCASTLDRTVPLERRRRPSLPIAQVTLAGR
jgi:Holliday junction resolvase RusA-like endonuclease